MTAWAQSLIRISNYEVETLQKRLAEISARKACLLYTSPSPRDS